MYAGDLGMLFEKSRDGHGRAALALDAHVERFHPANQQEGRFGIHRAADLNHVGAHFAHHRAAAGCGARDHVGMSGKIFRSAVHDDVEAHHKGLLQHGGGEGVVDQRQMPHSRANAAARCKSTSRSVGLVGVSM